MVILTNQETPLMWGDKRYHTWNHHLRKIHGQKICKIPLDGGFTCPNRNGEVAVGGCTFCSARGSGDFAGYRRDDLIKQFASGKKMMSAKWPDAKYLGYFQAFSNTYAPVEELQEKYEAILEQEDVIGLSIATRPDCLPDDVVEYLAELNERTYLWVELGLQTIHEHTSDLINRGHDTNCFLEGVAKLRKHGIRVCTHIIHGLPGETPDEMRETVRACANMDIQGIKIHLLHLLRNTPMVKQYEAGLLEFLDKDTYVGLVCDSLEMLPQDVIIHRITGDGPPDIMMGPMWSTKKWEVLNAIDKEMARRNSWQGKHAVARRKNQLSI
ncbi:TIGR01212 family radical SAM protein [Shimazuella kribbensis]|uniref:TIGR01212 family radical SAM protein n=1 Tax=Shimazuella kribbensis TaxID=139808 RepID=UPI000417238B|nr:TIGR01212 family radical SAM protein [Shimazuella kribbensis]